MDEIKSALDRALERADRMGKLSAEEMRRQNEVKYQPVGTAIAHRFFEHGEPSILSEQLQRLEKEGRDIAIKSALITMIESIDIDNRELFDRAVDGITGLVDLDVIEEAVDGIRTLFGQYAWQKKLLYEENSGEIGKEIRKKLSDAGISGTAVGEANIRNDEMWMRKEEALRFEFNELLNETKKGLKQLLQFQ